MKTNKRIRKKRVKSKFLKGAIKISDNRFTIKVKGQEVQCRKSGGLLKFLPLNLMDYILAILSQHGISVK